MAFEPGDVVTLPFPFADRNAAVARPALILTDASFGARSGVALVAMITAAKSTSWPFDTPIVDLASAGLKAPCVVRMKLNAIDLRLIARRIGALGKRDRTAVRLALRGVLAGALDE